jgi:SAM-dependent methyltransferase
MYKVKCNICGSSNCSVVYKTYPGGLITENKPYKITEYSITGPFRIVKCIQCGLIFMNPRPSEHILIDKHKDSMDDIYTVEETGRRIAVRKILESLARMGKSKGKLMNIGCPVGYLLDESKKTGWCVYGVELSDRAVAQARGKFGIDSIVHGVLQNGNYPDNYFDAVVLKDSIEHLTDPRSALIEIRRVLKADGVIVVDTPDINSLASRILKAKWWGINNYHLYYFNRASLSNLMEACGFNIIKSRYQARAFSLKYWITKTGIYIPVLCNPIIRLIGKKAIGNIMLTINLGDQLEVYAKKARKLEYLKELEKPHYQEKLKEKTKTIVVLPAYNAAKTLKITVSDIPKDIVDEIILVDDASKDETAEEAKRLGLTVYVHEKNKGYGGNQKTCYNKALEKGADIVVMVHPDYQYDPTAIPELIRPIQEGRADAVLGSRMMKGGALLGGMPLWKHNANIFLTAIENIVFGTFLTEYHSGFRAYSAKLLKSIRFDLNSNGFIFDSEIIAQILMHHMRIEEIPIRTRYFDEASKIKLLPCILYGLGILKTLCKYILHNRTFIKISQFQ